MKTKDFNKIIKKITSNELTPLQIVNLAFCLHFTMDRDNHGQIILYTGLCRDNNKIREMKKDDYEFDSEDE